MMNRPAIFTLIASCSGLLTHTAQGEGLGQFYAKLDIDAQSSEEGDGRFTEIKSNNSWIGVKGDVDLSDGLELVYRLEWKVDITGEDDTDTLTERPQYVGVRGRAGEITLGRNFTAVWMAQGKIDLFNHYEGDIKGLWKGENRLSDVATYASPSFNGIKAVVTYQAEKTADGDSAVSAGLFYGDRSLKSTTLFAALAHDFDVKGYDVTRASAQYKMGGIKLGAILQTQQPAVGGERESGGTVSVSYRQSEFDYKFQYQLLDDDNSTNVGIDYYLNKSAKVYAWYTRIDQEDRDDRNYLAIGFQYNLSYHF